MSTTEKQTENPPEADDLAGDFAEIAAQSQRLVTDFLARQTSGGRPDAPDPLNVVPAFMEMARRLMADPTPLMAAQMKLFNGYLSLWEQNTRRWLGGDADAAPAAAPASDDRRFRDPLWSENIFFDHMKQTYLLAAECLQSTVAGVEGLDDKTAQKVAFYTRQFVDSMAPTNFAATNPVVMRETVESKGQNLLRGLRNVLADLERGGGRLDIRMVDETAFELGVNLATSPGKVVFQNELIQLIQYAPTTKTAHRRPLLIAPPWINKFYILDLQPKNSFVRWAVSKGYTVFMISWVNPDADLAHLSFEDYMRAGPLAALDAIEQATGERDVIAIGYCLGGTLLAATLAYLAAKGDDRIKSATYFAALVDFAEPGELGVFIDEAQLDSLEATMRETGHLEGRHMATTFNMLRANDLIWSFVIHNYLLGKDPLPFDLLYWNSDSTRMPAAMHSFYLRKMYQENLLSAPGGITLDGVPIDLRRIDIPTYIVATREDHIAPWRSCLAATKLYAGETRFVLGASGHIAGIVNPPDAGKYNYWTGPPDAAGDPDSWLAAAKSHDGSWWTDWHRWQKPQAGARVAARKPGSGALAAIEDAPGSYVRVKS